MKVEAVHSTGSPVPQFIIYAENTTERALLAVFAEYAYNTGEYSFRFHGAAYEIDYPGARSFNFGVVRRKPLTESLVGRMLEKIGNLLLKLSRRIG